MSFISELKRRNVIRMAGLYLVGAWLVTQVASTVLPLFHAPIWMPRGVVIALAVGFVPAMIFAWIFELTPDGLKRDSDIPQEQSFAPQTAQKLNRLILALLVLAVVYFGVDKFVLAPKREAALVASALQAAKSKSEAIITDKSIAVLPFADMSQAKDQEWFGDGLAEEILNALVKTPDLRVAARTSSFKYKDSTLAVPQIAKELGVAHVLEGSIRSTPTRIRVTAQLIRAKDGFHLWSQTYDRDPADMISIQEDLARNIATVMQTTMDPKAMAEMATVGTRSVEAYQAYIRGVTLTQVGVDEIYLQAYGEFEKSREIDPTFAAAHSRAANFWRDQQLITTTNSGFTDAAPKQITQNFNERIDLAITHAANATDRLLYRSQKAEFGMHWREAIELGQAYLNERSSDESAIGKLLFTAVITSDFTLCADMLAKLWPLAKLREDIAHSHANHAHRCIDKTKAADMALDVLKRWPDNRDVLWQVQRAMLWDGRVQQAGVVLARLKELNGPQLTSYQALPLARQACAEGRRAEVEAILAQMPPSGDLSEKWHMLKLLGREKEAVDLLGSLERDGNTYALAGFLVFPQFDPTPYPSLMKILEREKVKRPPPVPIPFACPPVNKATSQ